MEPRHICTPSSLGYHTHSIGNNSLQNTGESGHGGVRLRNRIATDQSL